MRRNRIVTALTAVLLLVLCADAQAGRKARLRDQRDRALAEAKDAYEGGKQYAQSQLYDQAISRFEVAIAKFAEAEKADQKLPLRMQVPMDRILPLAHMNMGVCYIQKGQAYYSRASAEIERASQLQAGQRNPLIWYNVAAIRTLRGNLIEAIAALDRSLTLGFNNYDALRSDKDLYELRRIPEWRECLERHNVFL